MPSQIHVKITRPWCLIQRNFVIPRYQKAGQICRVFGKLVPKTASNSRSNILPLQIFPLNIYYYMMRSSAIS